MACRREGKEERGGGHDRAQDGGRLGGGRRVLGEAVACARQDIKARLERRARSGWHVGRGSRRWTAAACTAAAAGSCTGGRRKQSRGGRDAEGAQRKKKEEKKSKGSCGNLKWSRDFPVK
jgi:hypothetical protein